MQCFRARLTQASEEELPYLYVIIIISISTTDPHFRSHVFLYELILAPNMLHCLTYNERVKILPNVIGCEGMISAYYVLHNFLPLLSRESHVT